jgi:RND family efflux transporter MFP subunit
MPRLFGLGPFASAASAATRLALTTALLPALALLPSCRAAEASRKDTPAPAPAVHVETVKVSEVDAPRVLRLTGTLRGMKEADVAANAAGKVLRTTVERGDEVAAGQVVATLDTSSASLALAEAKVAVATSRTRDGINRTECARYEKLLATGAVSPAEVDNVTAKCKTAPLDLEAAEARQAIAAKNVGDGVLRAPFPGIVAERHVDVGEYVQPSSRVVTLAQIDELRLELAVPEANLAQVKRGTEVGFAVAAFPGRTFHGEIRFVAGAVRTSTRDLVAEAVVPNPDRTLRPGMFADVAVTLGTHKLPGVPRAAVFERQDKPRVFLVDGGRLVERVVALDVPLAPDAKPDAMLAVKDGVHAGEAVVVSDPGKLTNGALADAAKP